MNSIEMRGFEINEVRPAVLQGESHPHWPNRPRKVGRAPFISIWPAMVAGRSLRDWCRKHDIAFQGAGWKIDASFGDFSTFGKKCAVHISGSPQFCRPHWIFSPAHPESGACWFEATRLSVDKRPLKTQGIGLWMMLGDVRIAVLLSLGPAWNSFIWWSITEILRNSLVRDGK